MLSKDDLRKDFSKDYGKYYATKLFDEEGFMRKRCRACGKYFWTADSSRDLCGDSEHEPYTFMKSRPASVGYEEFWKKFAGFFKKQGHEEIGKYPVVSRWRQDLYFTIASIQDFQRIENGAMGFEYAANPLVVPQICLRFNDIPNTGVTVRHFTSFMMAGQHAFNYPKEGYWRDRTIKLNYDLLTEILGVKKKNLTYTEDVWAMGDFSEFGPCMESFSNGLELVNSVFTEFEYIDGKTKPLKGKVVDVGWGFERLMWFYAGTQTAYDVVFRHEMEYAYKNSGIKPDHALYAKVAGVLGEVDMSETKDATEKELAAIRKAGVDEHNYLEGIKPMQALYAIADHTRTLLFALADGALPSNVGGGYNLRILLRRAFDFMERYGLDIELMKLIELHAKDIGWLYSEPFDMDEISRVIDVERERYAKTKAEAHRIVDSIISRKEPLGIERMRTLYESNGITPEFIDSVAAKKGVKLDVPEEAYNKILKGDFVDKPKKRMKDLGIDTEGIMPTEKLFYDFAESADAKVLKSKDNMLVLDRTPFYAESGGQEADRGTIDGIKVTDVQSLNGIIVHVLEKVHVFKVGTKVHCEVDADRRRRLMAHHTATHLISAAARKVLGEHAWQEGAKKTASMAHIDVAHYERLGSEQISEIERAANSYILNGIRVKMEEMDRNDAERQFGFSIYQGHGVPAKRLRIVTVRDLDGKLIDAEACGGLHLMGRESRIGLIKIVSSSRIHDGIDRIMFVAGPAAEDYMNGMQHQLKSIAAAINVDADKVVQGVEQQAEALERLRKENGAALSQVIEAEKAKIMQAAQSGDVVKEVDYDSATMRAVATAVADAYPEATIVLYNKERNMVCVAGRKSGKNAMELANDRAKKLGMSFKGGGSERLAQGKLI